MSMTETQTTVRFKEGEKEYTLIITQPITYRPRYETKRNGHERQVLVGIDILSENESGKGIEKADEGVQLYRSGTDVGKQSANIPLIGLERKLIS